MADSRVTFAQWLAAFDNIAKAIQLEKAVMGDAFDISATETTGTLRETARYLLETRLRAWTSDSALALVTPAARAVLEQFESTAASTAMLANKYGPIIKGICAHIVNYGSSYYTGSTSTDITEKRYTDASAAWAALWANAGSSATNKRVLGEVVDVMGAMGMRWDPTYAVPPEHLELCRVTFSGAAAATFVTKNEIDPLKYTGHTAEWYVIARGTPAAATITLTAKDELDSATDDPGTSFATGSISDSKVAGDVGDVTQTDSHILHSTKGATLTVTGGENGLIVALRVKQFRAAAK